MPPEPWVIYCDNGITLYRFGPLRAELHLDRMEVYWRVWDMNAPVTLCQGQESTESAARSECFAWMRVLRDRELAASEAAKQRWKD